jgi:hypothetical protein
VQENWWACCALNACSLQDDGTHWVRSAVVSSENCTVLWIPLALFDFAYEPNSMEDSVAAGGSVSDGTSSDEDSTETPHPSSASLRKWHSVDSHAAGTGLPASGAPGVSWHVAVAKLQTRIERHERQMDIRFDELKDLMLQLLPPPATSAPKRQGTPERSRSVIESNHQSRQDNVRVENP